MAKGFLPLFFILSLILLSCGKFNSILCADLPSDIHIHEEKGPCAVYPIPVLGCNDIVCGDACIAKYGKYVNGGCMNSESCCCDFADM
ncbi:Uteroferrin-associated protein [Bienertia sinuspersici]